MSCLHFDGQIEEKVEEIIAPQNEDWVDWNLEELIENMKKYIVRNPLQMNGIVIIEMKATANNMKTTEKKNC